ncbi:MAG: hypothetical protein HBSIN02_25070 [Bacteroidia bacterium]|nr:MAG: hypothetical protein HBSIN02_25070 [Bacteroidia bacterium]
MRKVYFLTDYKGNFGSKYIALPYRSGMDKELLRRYLERHGLDAVFLGFSEVNFINSTFSGQFVVYTSAEDDGLFYKDYIEDILLGLQCKGAILIPKFEYFRAHHNKVFMEILRDVLNVEGTHNLRTRYFGTLEEFLREQHTFSGTSVIKPSAGSMSSGILLARGPEDHRMKAKKISKTRNLGLRFRDFLRQIRRKGYVKESWNRQKFIVQEYVPGLAEDWKVVVYGKKFYVLNRAVRKGDFRASGSGRFRYSEDVPTVVLELSERIFQAMDVPWLSLDIAVANGTPFLLEFQVIYFGTSTLDFSEFWFTKEGPIWRVNKGRSVLEIEFAASLASYINDKYGIR